MAAELTKYAIWLLSPLGIWGLLSFLAALGCLSQKKWCSGVWVLAHVQLLAFCLPWVGDALLGPLEQEARQLQASTPVPPQGVDAIVVLGGGMDGRFEGVRDLPDLNDSGDRLWVGARLYQQGISKRVVLSGGAFVADPRKEVEALSMKMLMTDLGVADHALILDGESRTTFENAVYTRQKLGSGAKRIALVTSAYHMGRAVLWFEKAGFTVYPVRADIRVLPDQRQAWEWLPSPQALSESSLAMKEYLGRLQPNVSAFYTRLGAHSATH